jgi:hypothetical protein
MAKTGKCINCQYYSPECARREQPHIVHQKNDSLCWCCENAVPDKDGKRGCEWSRYKQPVEGWEVSQVARVQDAKGRLVPSYTVARCPKFKRG